ncbi:MAG: CPBP family intramembrane glutamic endopeptidase, partial [bacterium]
TFINHTLLITISEIIMFGVPIILFYSIVSEYYNKKAQSDTYDLTNAKEFFSIRTISFKNIVLTVVVAVTTIIVMYCFRQLIYNVYYLITERTRLLGVNIINSNKTISTSNIQQLIILVISVVILPAILEELTFRGMLNGCCKYYSRSMIIVLSTVCFVFLHNDIAQVLLFIPMSIICMVIVIATKNVITSIIIHAFVNLYAILNIHNKIWFFNIDNLALTNNKIWANIFFSIAVIIILTILLCVLIFSIKKGVIKVELTMKEDNTRIINKSYENNKFKVLTLVPFVFNIIIYITYFISRMHH